MKKSATNIHGKFHTTKVNGCFLFFLVEAEVIGA